MKNKKIPLRKCLGCEENKSKKELIRIVKTPENELLIDLTGKINGRGAYICNNKNCFERAMKSNRISRNLEVKIPKEKIQELEENIQND
nr:YlxR family protein [Tissierella sp.]